MIQIGVGGATGKTGRFVVEAIEQDSEACLAIAVSSQRPLQSNAVLDVFIDFSTPFVTLAHLEICRQQGWRMVIGTTGFSPDEQAVIQQAGKEIPIVLSPNMSLGVNLCFNALEGFSVAMGGRKMDKESEAAIIDIHQRHKKEATRPDRFFSYHEKTRLLDRTPAHPYNASAIVLYNPPPPCDSLGV